MRGACRLPVVLGSIICAACFTVTAYAESGESTRVTDDKQHACADGGGYPYRKKSAYVLGELDLKPGDVVVDVGAGDGWWTELMAKKVGPKGTVHASEVDQGKVDQMKKMFARTAHVKPYLCPTDGTGLPENSCDLAFLSKTYHHLDKDGLIDYLQHLHDVVKPTGRLCVIERHTRLSTGKSVDHAWDPGLLMQQAEEAGWITIRYELITGTYHFIAIFVPQELFPLESPRKKQNKKRPDKPKER
jgi:predicted methyltransferase